MAKILVTNEQDSIFLDSFNCIVPLNFYNKNKNIFRVENFLTFNIDESYNYRPDKVAYKVYGIDYYYPVILACNNIGSILQFNISKIGSRIYYLNPDYLKYIQF